MDRIRRMMGKQDPYAYRADGTAERVWHVQHRRGGRTRMVVTDEGRIPPYGHMMRARGRVRGGEVPDGMTWRPKKNVEVAAVMTSNRYALLADASDGGVEAGMAAGDVQGKQGMR